EEGAADILRLCDLADEDDRAVRLTRLDIDAPRHFRLQTYRRGALIPLSDVVPVLENFGFRVLEEFPTALSSNNGYIHDFRVDLAAGTDEEGILPLAVCIEDAIARVLRGTAEDDEFNQLVLYAELDMQSVVWLR